LERARADVAQIQTEIDRATVRSPLAGEVLQVNVRAGEHVDSQPDLPLVALGSVRRLHVRADIDETDISRFSPNAAATAQARGLSEQRVPLELVRVEPLVVAKRSLTGDNTERVDTRVLQVIYALVGDAPLFVGQQVDVSIVAREAGADPLTRYRPFTGSAGPPVQFAQGGN